MLKLAALEERTADLKGQLERIEDLLTALVERLARVEGRQAQLEGGRSSAASPDGAEPALDDLQPARPFLNSYSEE